MLSPIIPTIVIGAMKFYILTVLGKAADVFPGRDALIADASQDHFKIRFHYCAIFERRLCWFK
jgi:hypothetical protein